jgi:formate/nitrite transporter FocA (FNT family)
MLTAFSCSAPAMMVAGLILILAAFAATYKWRRKLFATTWWRLAIVLGCFIAGALIFGAGLAAAYDNSVCLEVHNP